MNALLRLHARSSHNGNGNGCLKSLAEADQSRADRRNVPPIGAPRYHLGTLGTPEEAERVADVLSGAPFFVMLEQRHTSLYHISDPDVVTPRELTDALRSFVQSAAVLRRCLFAAK